MADVPVVNFAESLAVELQANATLLQERLCKAISKRMLPESYFNHPGVIDAQRSGADHPQPYAIYMDGLDFQPADSTLAIYVYWVLWGVRHLAVNIRKSQFCRCGCQGIRERRCEERNLKREKRSPDRRTVLDGNLSMLQPPNF